MPATLAGSDAALASGGGPVEGCGSGVFRQQSTAVAVLMRTACGPDAHGLYLHDSVVWPLLIRVEFRLRIGRIVMLHQHGIGQFRGLSVEGHPDPGAKARLALE